MITKNIVHLTDAETAVAKSLLQREELSDGRPGTIELPDGKFLIEDTDALQFLRELDGKKGKSLASLRFAHYSPQSVKELLSTKVASPFQKKCLDQFLQLGVVGTDVSHFHDVMELLMLMDGIPSVALEDERINALAKHVKAVTDYGIMNDVLAAVQTLRDRNKVNQEDINDLVVAKYLAMYRQMDVVAVMYTLEAIADLEKLIASYDRDRLAQVVPDLLRLVDLKHDLVAGNFTVRCRPLLVPSFAGAGYVSAQDNIMFHEVFDRDVSGVLSNVMTPYQEVIHELVHVLQDKERRHRSIGQGEGEAYAIDTLYLLLKFGEESPKEFYLSQRGDTMKDPDGQLIPNMNVFLGPEFVSHFVEQGKETDYRRVSLEWASDTLREIRGHDFPKPVSTVPVGESYAKKLASEQFLTFLWDPDYTLKLARWWVWSRGGTEWNDDILNVSWNTSNWEYGLEFKEFSFPDDLNRAVSVLQDSGEALQKRWKAILKNPEHWSSEMWLFGDPPTKVAFQLLLAAVAKKAVDEKFDMVRYFNEIIFQLLTASVALRVGGDPDDLGFEHATSPSSLDSTEAAKAVTAGEALP